MPELPRVKVCGLTRAEDVALAATAGADAVGFVLHPPSPRAVAPAALPALVAAAPAGVWTVLVLVDREPETVAALVAASGAGAVQLCGREEPDAWRDFPVPVLRRLPVAAGAAAAARAWAPVAAGFVLDHPAAPGGSGRRVDLELAAALAAAHPCLLAGGLGPETVAAAVARVRPRGVDASSALEHVPGRKDPVRVRAFVAAARYALAAAGHRPENSR